jgi:hypothetical protein
MKRLPFICNFCFYFEDGFRLPRQRWQAATTQQGTRETHGVIASAAKQSSRAPAGAPNKALRLRRLQRLLVGALRARWIASSLRSSQ